MKLATRLIILPLTILTLSACETSISNMSSGTSLSSSEDMSSLAPTSTLTSTITSAMTSTGTSTTSLPPSSMPGSLSLTRTITEMLNILYTAGYEDIEDLNNSGMWDFREQTYQGDYGVVVDVIGFYQGYIPSFTRWMMMEEFATQEQAGAVADALLDSQNYSYNLHREGNILLQTSSVDTWMLFQGAHN